MRGGTDEAARMVEFLNLQAVSGGQKQIARGEKIDDVLAAGMLYGFSLGLECAKNAPEWAMMIFEGIRTNIDELPLGDKESRERVDRLIMAIKLSAP